MFMFGLEASFGETRTRINDRCLLSGFPGPCSDGTEVVASRSAVAAVGRWAVVRRDKRAAPLWKASSGLLFTGDVRLYNRPELIAELGSAPSLSECPDLELAALAYERWADASPLHLVGDFAFAAWDEKKRSVFAARDHLGVRPIFFHYHEDGVSIASDVRQLLRLLDEPIEHVNADTVLDWFAGSVRDLRGTFFRGITRIRPGHFIVADAQGVRERRYWFPPQTSSGSSSYEENCERLLGTFRRAVTDRIESDYPLVAHSSGGFDSSTILMVADEIYRRDSTRPPLITASAIAPGYPSDESFYMDAVAAHVSFESIRWNVVSETPHTFPGVSRAAPILRTGLAGGALRDLEIASARNARVLLSGMLGDDVMHATGVLRDLLRRGHWRQLLASIPRRGPASVWRALVDAGLGVLSPGSIQTLSDRSLTPLSAPADWMGPALRALFPLASFVSNASDVSWSTHLASKLWARLTSSHAAGIVDSMVTHGAEVGIEVRMPYADVRLIDEVFRFPWGQRAPRGDHRRTAKDAIGRLLPREFEKRPDQPSWSAVRDANVKSITATLASFIQGGSWLSAPYVDRGMARSVFRNVLGTMRDVPAAARYRVYEFGVFEAWLRMVLEYNPAAR